jgi:benzaldehyde dehydrogenase (NAD)
MNDVKLLINGNAVPATGGKVFERRNPISGQVVTRAAAASPQDADLAVAAASAAFPKWSALGPNDRRTQLLAAAQRLLEAGPELMRLMIEETGAAKPWAEFNLRLACGMLRDAAAMTTQMTGEVIASDRPGVLSMAVREPHGVVLSIAPWNAPLVLCVRALAMPLACGNAVVLKASELCPATHCKIGEVVGAGLPPGTLNVLTHAAEDAPALVSALIAHPAVRHINFTGSSGVGRIIAEQAGRHLKPALLELGGKSPLIVLDDADLDEAVNAAAFGAFMNSGQICMATEKIIVHEAVADEFARRLAKKAASLPAGDPGKKPVVLGSLVSTQAVDKTEALIADAVAKGAKRLSGGWREGSMMDATILDHVTPAMRIYTEETFGPAVPIVRAKDEDEAVRIANDTDYGLSAAVFTQDIARGLRIARRIESGICHINGPTIQDEAQVPFGGVKASGIGRFGGRYGVEAFSQLRWLSIETQHQHYPF